MNDTGGLIVVVREQIDGPHWKDVVTESVADLDEGAKLAYKLAREHRPVRPSQPRERTVFRRPDGSWLVRVQGAMKRFEFTVTVMEVEGVYPDSRE